ncbi:MAG TPA: hypothetical protein VNR38_19525 [Ureibacillus sp.]|nr:hypothetical protein [Ureibacillus sp.]
MDLTPLIISLLFYGVPIFMMLWFMVSVVTALRERNELLRALIKKLDNNRNKED